MCPFGPTGSREFFITLWNINSLWSYNAVLVRWIRLRYTLVGYPAGLEVVAASATGAHDADTPVRTGATRRLESRSAVRVPIVIPPAAWTAARIAVCADRLRPLLAAPACP